MKGAILMNTKKFMHVLFVLWVGVFVGCEKNEEEPTERTVLVYIAGDNNLSTFGNRDILRMIEGMEQVPNNMRLLVYWDQSLNGAKLIEIDPRKGSTIDEQPVLKVYGEENSASAEVLRRVIQETKELAPANSYGLVLWSHGLGWLPKSRSLYSKSFGVDHSQEIDLPDLAAALEDGDFEYILFDACLMGGVEVCYELRHKCKYIIASPHEVLVESFPYDAIVPSLWGGEEELRAICTAYYDYYQQKSGGERSATVALIRTSELDALYNLCSEILTGKLAEVQVLGQNEVYFYHTPNSSPYNKISFDLDDFIACVATAEQYTAFAAQLDKVVLKTCATAKFYNEDILKFCGLSVYIPRSVWTGLNPYYLNTISWAGVYGLD